MSNNGDTTRKFKVCEEEIVGVGSFHKTLPHNKYGEVDSASFNTFVKATQGTAEFIAVPKGSVQQNPSIPNEKTAPFVNPQAGLAHDRLTRHPAGFDMPPAPTALSITAATEITELYWMSLLRDIPFDKFATDASISQAAAELNDKFKMAVQDVGDAGHLKTGIDVPGAAETLDPITSQNVFRLGLPGEAVGPFVSQFFIRGVNFGTQTINQKQRPYRKGKNYLTSFNSWLHAQNSGNGDDGLAYPRANEAKEEYYEDQDKVRYISTMRDLARFVNKDALHQAYFNAALLLLSAGAKWTPGNPYGDDGRLAGREAGFATLGGPHILALVSEVATRALKIVWNQKWQIHLRLRPEAYAWSSSCTEHRSGVALTRPYGLPEWASQTQAAEAVRAMNKHCGEESLLLPMAFTPGSPAHPAYGAGHATVAGACVTVLKAYFKTFDVNPDGKVVPLPIASLTEKSAPYADSKPFRTYITGVDECGFGFRNHIDAADMTIEGELNKLAMNVAMGRTMGGVHWRTDNTRSLVLGEAIAAQILADITVDLVEHPTFEFRTFSRKADGQPKIVEIQQGRIKVDGVLVDSNSSAL